MRSFVCFKSSSRHLQTLNSIHLQISFAAKVAPLGYSQLFKLTGFGTS